MNKDRNRFKIKANVFLGAPYFTIPRYEYKADWHG
jgi:hypothetical protein